MLTKDYIMRMIDSLIKVMERVLLLKKSKNYNEGLDEIEKVTKELFGFDRNFINNLSDSQLIKMISVSDTLIAPNCYLLGALFKEEAEIYKLQGEPEKSTEMYERSFNFFIEGLRNSTVEIEPDHLTKIKSVIEALGDEPISVVTESNLAFYYEFTGNFDKAEDIIYDLIEFDSKYINDGIQFCERLLEKDDDVLIQGNLPREEITESLAALKERLKNV
jgi:tetratricopeptide (TPR) repeat protein